MLTPKDAILFKIVRTCAMTPKDAILFKIVHTCAKECLILTYIICPESLTIVPKVKSRRAISGSINYVTFWAEISGVCNQQYNNGALIFLLVPTSLVPFNTMFTFWIMGPAREWWSGA